MCDDSQRRSAEGEMLILEEEIARLDIAGATIVELMDRLQQGHQDVRLDSSTRRLREIVSALLRFLARRGSRPQ